MRINTNVSALNAQRNLWSTQQDQTRSMDKLSSGFRINRASDDAAGLAISNVLRADTRSLTQASRNSEQANSMLQIAEGGASTIQKMLERMKELATQAASDNNSSQGQTLNAEFGQLQSEIDRIANSTMYQGTTLLGGTTATFQIGAKNNTNDRLTMTLTSLSTTTLSVGSTAANVTSIATAQSAMTAIDSALTTVNTFLGNIGANQNRLQYAQSNIKTSIQNFSAAESVIRDLDMAEEMTKFSKLGILSQAGTAMLAQANQSTQGVLSLLRG
jgi:flagellin